MTLALRSQPKQGLVKVQAKSEAQKSHFIFPRVYESVREWNHTLPSGFTFWELEFQWTPEFSKNDYNSQNSLDWKVPCTIGNLLKLRCVKWARTPHLNI
jgi:hypothetical protein